MNARTASLSPEELAEHEKMYTSTAAGNDHATTTILNLRASLEERDSTVAKLEKALATANGDLERWRATFQSEGVLPLIPNPEPRAVLGAFQKLQGSETEIQEQFQGA